MFNNDDIVPKTYSVKSYKSSRKPGLIKKILLYITCFILVIIVLGITALSVAHVI